MNSGGIANARGLEYQIEASVWIALELLLKAGQANAVEIEPVNSEDLQAELDGDMVEASVCVTRPGNFRAVYQMKTRGTGPWSKSTLKGIVGNGLARAAGKRGGQPRQLALEVLRNEHQNVYFFVTNAAVDSELLPLSDEHLAFGPSNIDLPADFLADEIRAQAHSVRGRIRLLPGTTLEVIRSRVKELLNSVGKVPQAKLDACFRALKDAFRLRIIDEEDRQFDKAHLAAVLRCYGGLRPPFGGAYVPPDSIDMIRACLHSRHVVLLVGPAGVGKSMLADFLAAQYRHATPPFDSVLVTNLVALRNALDRPGPTLIVVIDPWGNHMANGHSPLAAELPHLIGQASADKLIVITTRNDIYATVPLYTRHVLQPHAVDFTAADYSPDALWEIVLVNTDLGANKRELIAPYRDRILAELRIPKALARFGRILAEAGEELIATMGAFFNIDVLLGFEYQDENYDVICQTIRRAEDDVFGSNALLILGQWHHYPVEHTTLLWVLAETGIATEVESVLRLAGLLSERSGMSFALPEYLRYLEQTGIAEVRDGIIHVHSFALARMAELAATQLTPAGHLVTQLSTLYMSRQERSGHLHDCLLALAILNVFGREPSWSSGWAALSQRIDIAIRQACAPCDDVFLTDEEYTDDPFQDAERFRIGIDAALMWRWPQSPLTRLVRALGVKTGEIYKPDREELGHLVESGVLRELIARFFVDYLPETTLPFTNVKLIVDLIRRFGLDVDVPLRASLRRIEYRNYADDGDGGYEYERNPNFDTLSQVLDATSNLPYEALFPKETLPPFNPMK